MKLIRIKQLAKIEPVHKLLNRKKEETTHTSHFIYGYMKSDMW